MKFNSSSTTYLIEMSTNASDNWKMTSARWN